MARKGHGEGGASEDRWLLTYSDLITLLLAFFIIMYSSSKADLAKFDQLAKSFQQAFGVAGLPGGQGLLNESAGMFDFGALSPAQQQFMQISEQLQSYVSKSGQANMIDVNLRPEGIAVTLSNALLFPSGGTALGPDSRKALARIADLIRPLPNDIRVEAHTDNLPTDSAIYPTNWELSAARAASVARFLIDQEGIAPARLSVLGYGEYRPLFPNDTVEHRAENRRADIVILYPSQRVAPVVDMSTSTP